jgi:hypothetical protein
MRVRDLTDFLTPALLLFGLSVLAASSAYAQGTPDGETPVNEGVCDELLGATPGLYGLCVGFCEAQDCVTILDEATDEVTFDPSCNPSSPWLLKNYNKRATPGDPSMPCINTKATECPCWTEEELDGLSIYRQHCRETASFTSFSDIVQCPGGRFPPPETAKVFEGNLCSFRKVVDQTTCSWISRQLEITADEYMICRDSIRAECEERGIPLP